MIQAGAGSIGPRVRVDRAAIRVHRSAIRIHSSGIRVCLRRSGVAHRASGAYHRASGAYHRTSGIARVRSPLARPKSPVRDLHSESLNMDRPSAINAAVARRVSGSEIRSFNDATGTRERSSWKLWANFMTRFGPTDSANEPERLRWTPSRGQVGVAPVPAGTDWRPERSAMRSPSTPSETCRRRLKI